jgi:outer membrane protein OmpA-like peptidoglycan-associated protein/Mg-chelatase subunit ChlD
MSANLLEAQSAYQKQIDKAKFTKIEKKLNKVLKKTPDDPVANFYLGVIYINRGFASYNPYTSFDYLEKSKRDFDMVKDEKEMKKLLKLPLDHSIYFNYNDTVYMRGLEDATNLNSVEAYEKYLAYFPNADLKYLSTAVSKRDIAAFKVATDKNTVESYQYFIDRYPSAVQKDAAIKERNSRAFENAQAIDKIEAYYTFIDKYPNAADIPRAWERIHELAFQQAEKENTITAFEKFIEKYPRAKQVQQAYENIHLLAFNQAKAANSSKAMYNFLNKYPKAKQYNEAYQLYEELQYSENIIPADWTSYGRFIEKYPANSLVNRAKDKLVEIALSSKDFIILDYCVRNFSNDQNVVDMHYEIFTKDGELSTIQKYQNLYINSPSKISTDLHNAEIADKFLLHLPFNSNNQNAYVDYVENVWDKDLTYVILQRLISPFLEKNDYKGALKFIDGLSIDKNSKFYKNISALLSSPIDYSIKPAALKGLNSTGNEFSPVPTADEKRIYFCGQNRTDNLGGEDIYEANGSKGYFTIPKLESSLSTSNANEAPVSISSDGTTMLLFQAGKLYYSIKTTSGWSEKIELDRNINNGEWQGDAMISSDGNSILFSAVRESETYNTNKISDKYYHGGLQYPTDLFVSSRDANGNWSYPVNLGATINTRYCERFPFLHPDMKSLYFSSDGHGGLGKMDVFKTTRLNDSCWTCWSEPINMGKEINTSEDDAGYKISTSGDKAYFTLNKRKSSETSVLFLLDVSGSMAGNKFLELKKVSKTTCEDVINNNAEVAIAAFDGTCFNPLTYYLPFTKDFSAVRDFIDNLNVSGGTPMYEAYYQASQILADESDKKIKNKIMVLMTDGDANSCNDLEKVLNELRRNNRLFKTQTIAYQVSEFSRAYTDLTMISTKSKGEFFHAATTEDLGSAFEKASANIYEIVAGPDNKDLYSLNLPQHLRPDYVATVSGKLVDSKNKAISTRIIWEDLEAKKTIGVARTDPKDGAYFIVLPMGKNYGYYIEDTAYFPISTNLDLRNTNKAVELKNDISAVTFDEMINQGIGVSINNLFFEFAKYNVLPQSIPELQRVANIVNSKNLKVEISGHTDNVGDDKTNQKLSEMRASAVKDFLVSLGCNPALLNTNGYGKSKPIAPNDTDLGRAKNRRVELKFIK